MKRVLSIFNQPTLWIFLFIGWASVLFILSSSTLEVPEKVYKVPYYDKIAHFIYFFIGSLILSTWLILKHDFKATSLSRHIIVRIILPIIFFGILGAIDEYRQSLTPGRSGNDLHDWLADLLGATCGILLANVFHPLRKKNAAPAITYSIY